jgi:alpha-tubulin suppressor-like RCC1 family protein
VFASSTLNDGDLLSFNAFNQTTNCYQTFHDTIHMDVQTVPAITPLSTTTFCEGDSVVLVSNQTNGNQWAVNGVNVNGTTDSTLVVNVSGVVDLTFTSGILNQLLSFGYNANGMFANGNNQSDSIPTPWNANLNLQQISSGWKFSLGLNNLNQVFSWGNNAEGQLGNGTFTSTNAPIALPAILNAKNIATSESSSMVVNTSGGVYVWGNNTFGQLGTGNFSVYNFPYLNPTLNNIDTVVGGRRHFLLLRNDGKVLAVGNNSFGQLGNGTLTTSNVPVLINGLSGIEKIGAGEFHSFAIDSSGHTFVWGNNTSGQLGLNDLNSRLQPTALNLLNLVQVTGGADFTLFLNANGQLFASGKNNFAQLGVGDFVDRQVPTMLNMYGVESIACGQYHSLALRNDASVYGFGSHLEGQLSTFPFSLIPTELTNLHGTGFIECGKSTSHVITIQIASCQANSVNVVVNPAAVPTLVYSNGTLTTPAIGVAYQWYFGGQEILNNNTPTYVPINPGYYSVSVTYANGCSALSSEFAFNIQGIANVEINTVELSPNPTRDQLHIFFKNPMILGELKVVDAFGKNIASMDIQALNDMTLDVSTYLPGVYFLRFSNQMTARFVVIH